MNELKDEKLRKSYQNIMNSMVAPEEEKTKVINVCCDDGTSSKASRRKWHISKVAVAALTGVCILALSGGVVWAMNSSLLNDVFFSNSEQGISEIFTDNDKAGAPVAEDKVVTVENGSVSDTKKTEESDLTDINDSEDIPAENEVNGEGVLADNITNDEFIPISEPVSDEIWENVRFSSVGAEYPIGNYRIVYEGSGYDKAVSRGYLFFSLWDKDGNPVETEQLKLNEYNLGAMSLRRRIQTHEIQLDGEEINFIFYESNNMFTNLGGNCFYFIFSRLSWDDNDPSKNDDIHFLVLNKKDADKVKEEIGRLPVSALDRNFDSINPEVVKILEKYNPNSIKAIDAQPQIIEFDALKLTVGRMDLKIDYNVKNLKVDSFVLRRDDGTEITYTYDNGDWKAIGNGKYRTGNGTEITDQKAAWVLSLGFVLGADEKVTIEADGKTYR
ncbi:MAG: hypothetical protein IKP88_11185 [Lachnospiraceae bacterium]|nr:hypothetical protein [Lachnospiraceae bacterium]